MKVSCVPKIGIVALNDVNCLTCMGSLMCFKMRTFCVNFFTVGEVTFVGSSL